MATLLEQSKRLKSLSQKRIEKQLFLAIKEVEGKFIKFNKLQLVKGKDNEGDVVGSYADVTQAYAEADGIPNAKSKKGGNDYNFVWSGDFFEGFNLSISGTEAIISSSGVGSGEKKEFLTTNNLFGLTEENLAKVIKSDILPFIQRYARTVLKI